MLVPNDQGQFILQGEGGWEVTDEDLSGQTVCIPSGDYTHMNFQGLKGSEGAPILITNCGQGRVVIDAEGASAALGANTAAHLRILGTGDPEEPYGFHFKNAGSWTGVINMKEGATNIEVGYVEVEGPGYTGIAIQTYPYCDASLGRDAFTQYDTHVHHSYVHDIAGEGIYIGPSHYHEEISPTSVSGGCPGGFAEAALHGVEVHHNLVEDTGRDAIQVGAAIEGMRIHDNVIRRYALLGDWGHTGGIQINPGSVGHVFNNHIDATGLETFDNAFQVAGGVDGPTYIYNNVVVGSEVPFLKLNRMGHPESPVYVMNNTFVLNPEKSSTLSIACAEAWEQPFFITNNIFTEYAYVGTFIYENEDGVAYSKIIGDQNDNCPINGEIYLNGPDTDQQIPGNLYLKDSQNVGFAALNQGDYHLLAGSPAVGTGEDLSDLVTDDYDGQARPTGPFDLGAYVYLEDYLGCEDTTVYRDADGDGYGDPDDAMSACGAIEGYIAQGDDCCDSDADAFPANGLSATVPNDCGDYDYDCDGEETLGEAGTASCPDTVTFGYEGECGPIGAGWVAAGTEDDWLTPPPACGQSGLLLDSCGYDVIWEPMINDNIYVCRPFWSEAVQSCH